MAAASSLSHQICDIVSCSICLETLKEPKVLPCIHTFCLHCLDSYCESKAEEEEVSCPLCRTVFSIPPGGIQDLPNNFFIHQLLNVNISTVATGAQESVKPTVCELCSESETEVKATCYCIECDQHICERCSAIHKKAKSSKHHQVVCGGNILVSEMRTKLAGRYCDQHPDEKHRLYCYDCQIIMCNKCLSKHSQHKCSDVSESAEKFRQFLNEDINKVSACVSHLQEHLTKIDVEAERFFKRVTFTESEISQKYDELKSVLQSHKSQLMEELNQFKNKASKKIEIEKDEIQRQFVIRESFRRYCLEMLEKGTACDISRTAHDLHARAEELGNIQDEPDCSRLGKVEIQFKPSLSMIECVNSMKNFIGGLVLTAEIDTTRCYQIKKETNLERFLTNSKKLLRVMPGAGSEVTGMTVLGSDVFVVRCTSQVNVYKSDDFTLIRTFTITGSNHLVGLVSCSYYNCLYATDPFGKIIYRHDLTSNVTTNWSVYESSFRLSVTKCYNLLVTVYGGDIIQEYTTDGSLIRNIKLHSSIDNPWHCVQLSTGNYVVCHRGGLQHRVCIVDQSGRIIKSYGRTPGCGSQMLNKPLHLAVDIRDNVLVADGSNNRVQLLSPTLTHLGDIVIADHQLNRPYALHFDDQNNRLYIGENTGRRLFVLQCDY